MRTCPFCHMDTNAAVSLCSHCSRFSKIKNNAVRSSLPSKLSAWIESVESRSGWIQTSLDRLHHLNIVMPKAIRIAALACIVFLIVMPFTLGLGTFGTIYWLIRGIYLAILGCAISVYLGARDHEARTHLEESTDIVPDYCVKALGHCSNLLVAQSISLVIALTYLAQDKYDTAWIWAWIAVAFVIPLVTTSRRLWAIAIASISGCAIYYICGLYNVNAFTYTVNQEIALNQPASPIIDSFIDVIQIILVIAVFPQLEVIRIGRSGIGRLRGDFHMKLLGSKVSIAFGSAIITLALYYVITEIRNLPGWFGLYNS
jgi:hypothetical protein